MYLVWFQMHVFISCYHFDFVPFVSFFGHRMLASCLVSTIRKVFVSVACSSYHYVIVFIHYRNFESRSFCSCTSCLFVHVVKPLFSSSFLHLSFKDFIQWSHHNFPIVLVDCAFNVVIVYSVFPQTVHITLCRLLTHII